MVPAFNSLSIGSLFSTFPDSLLSLACSVNLMRTSAFILEKSRGGLLDSHIILGARAAPAHAECDPQYGAAPSLLQSTQSSFQQ